MKRPAVAASVHDDEEEEEEGVEAGAENAAAPACKAYKVVGHPHLGLSLKLSKVYTLSAMEKRCDGEAALRALHTKLKDATLFQLTTSDAKVKAAAKTKPRPSKVAKVKAASAAAAAATVAPPPPSCPLPPSTEDQEAAASYRVIGYANLGLSLKRSAVYGVLDLEKRCGGDAAKLRVLHVKLQDATLFQPVSHGGKQAAPVRKGKAPKAKAKAEAKAGAGKKKEDEKKDAAASEEAATLS